MILCSEQPYSLGMQWFRSSLFRAIVALKEPGYGSDLLSGVVRGEFAFAANFQNLPFHAGGAQRPLAVIGQPVGLS